MCQSSRWLSMNVFSINKNKIVVEEGEKPLINFLEHELGMDVCPIPFRQVRDGFFRKFNGDRSDISANVAESFTHSLRRT